MDLSPILKAIGEHPTASMILGRAGLVLLTLVAARIVLSLLRTARDSAVERVNRLHPPGSDSASSERALHLGTLINVLSDVVSALIYGFVVLTALSQFGVSVQPLVAGAGLVGAAVALGSQTIVKDFVSGCFILLENHFVIGDQIIISPTIAGTVERMTLRVTAIRDADGAVHIIPNGTISTVTNKTYRWSGAYVSLATPASAGVAPVREALERAIKAAEQREEARPLLLSPPVVAGPVNIKGTSLEWTISAKTPSGEGARVKSWLIEAVVAELAAAQINLA